MAPALEPGLVVQSVASLYATSLIAGYLPSWLTTHEEILDVWLDTPFSGDEPILTVTAVVTAAAADPPIASPAAPMPVRRRNSRRLVRVSSSIAPIAPPRSRPVSDSIRYSRRMGCAACGGGRPKQTVHRVIWPDGRTSRYATEAEARAAATINNGTYAPVQQ